MKFPPSETLQRLINRPDFYRYSIDTLRKGDTLRIAGYPVHHWFEFKKNNGENQFTNATSSYTIHENKALVDYRMNTRGGSSGSPLWVRRGNKIFLVGIHKSGKLKHNQGILYDEKKMGIIERFMKQ